MAIYRRFLWCCSVIPPSRQAPYCGRPGAGSRDETPRRSSNDPPALRQETSPCLLANLGRMSISLHPDTPEGRTLAASPVAGAEPAAGPTGTKITQPAVHQICRAVRRGGRRRATVQRDFRGFLLLSRAQGLPDPDSARAGRGRGGEDRPVRQGDRKPAGLDHPVALVRELAREPPVRCLAAAAAGAGHHRTGAGRFDRQGALAGVAPRDGRCG